MKMSVRTEEGGGGTEPTTTTNHPHPTSGGVVEPRKISTSSGGGGGTGGVGVMSSTNTSDVVKSGYLRKLKGKKKWFVVRRETETGGPARLEYYANERKFKMGHPPRKSIQLKACFNINRTDAKVKWAIALHTHNDCVRIAYSTEEEMNEWLRILNSLAGDDIDEEDTSFPLSMENPPKPHFEHVWLVTALNKGLGSKENIVGPYRLCLTSKEVTLLKVGDLTEKNSMIKFPLNVIRSVSHDTTIGCFFHIEFGRLAVTGPGQLSLKTEDNNIAQNMHLLILKAMQNYSKEETLPRDSSRTRGRTYTWNSDSGTAAGRYYGTGSSAMSSLPYHSHSQTPPIMSRLNSSAEGSIGRIRTESNCSNDSRSGFMEACSPPLPIPSELTSPPPSISFCSTTTDSASSSYSVDYENNNGSRMMMGLGMEGVMGSSPNSAGVISDESYVPWNPGTEDHHHNQTTSVIPSSISLPISLQPADNVDYVETTPGKTSNTSESASAYMEMQMQSPTTLYDVYIPMSPGNPIISTGTAKSTDKINVSHSRNSSLVEEQDGYIPMVPGSGSVTAPNFNGLGRCESEGCSQPGSISGLDSYLEMDLSRKLNLSNDDFHRMSPASSESLGSGTPSSDFPLEKVSSYLLPSEDDELLGPRPMRAYSVGSRSETAARRFGKNRLEAVQETSRIRAFSVGSKTPRPNKPLFSPPSGQGSSSSVSTPPLSSSWNGSSGVRWLQQAAAAVQQTNGGKLPPISPAPSIQQPDPDLMELDFSHNKDKAKRKRSLPVSDTFDFLSSAPSGGKFRSAPISIKPDITSNVPQNIVPILTRSDLKPNKPMESEGGDSGDYLEMSCSSGVVVKPSESLVPTSFNLAVSKPESLCISSTTSPSTTVTTTSSASPGGQLSRIEESPEKVELVNSSPGATQVLTYATLALPPKGTPPTGPPRYPNIPSNVMYSQIDFAATKSTD